MDEEPEPQVMARERRHVRLQPLRGAQATERRPRQLRAGLVVADEGDAALRRLVPRLRLRRVVQEGAEAQGLAAGELVGQRLSHDRGRGLGVLAER